MALRHEAPPVDDAASVHLLGGFELRGRAGTIDVPLGTQRLLAFLVLRERPVLRGYVVGSLWPDSCESRAAASLRSALWRVNGAGTKVVDATATHVRLDPLVGVDVHAAVAQARALVDDAPTEDDRVEHGDDVGRVALCDELLPDWYDDWVMLERERLHHLGLHALEALSRRLARRGRFAEAVDTALLAVRGEPLRESAHRCLIEAHVAEGNPAHAVAHYERYRRLLHDSLGVEPTGRMHDLVDGLRAAR
jgi:DNA-binding SARP family transcriptional activator